MLNKDEVVRRAETKFAKPWTDMLQSAVDVLLTTASSRDIRHAFIEDQIGGAAKTVDLDIVLVGVNSILELNYYKDTDAVDIYEGDLRPITHVAVTMDASKESLEIAMFLGSSDIWSWESTLPKQLPELRKLALVLLDRPGAN